LGNPAAENLQKKKKIGSPFIFDFDPEHKKFPPFYHLKTMAKTKSKPAAAAPEKKAGDGGRIKKQTSAIEQTKATAKSVVAATKNAASKAVAAAADTEAGSKLKGILKNAVVFPKDMIMF
jgi:hypothetical protein